MRRSILLLLLLLGLQACGTKGPLYLPPAETPDNKSDIKSKQ